VSEKGDFEGEDSTELVARARGALHDVSNALTVVLGWVREAESPELSPEEARAALRMVDVHARRARDLARAAIGAEVPSSGAAPVDGVVDEVLASLSVAAREREVLLVREGHGGLAVAEAATDLHHVLENLLMNALAYSPEGGLVRVTLDARTEHVRIEVADEGPGVPAAARETLFSGVSTREGGAGVGLRHSQKVARRAGGDLVLVPSEKGATFRVVWPRSDHAPRPSGTSVRGSASLAGLRFLLVEDDPAVSSLLDAALEARGAEVVLVRNHAELDQALAVPHDGAIVDLSPLEGHVREDFARISEAARPSAPLVLTTGSVDAVPDDLAASSSRVKLVRKPFELGDVIAALVT
jgi:CheY-like chemotaxis protein